MSAREDNRGRALPGMRMTKPPVPTTDATKRLFLPQNAFNFCKSENLYHTYFVVK